MGSRNIRITWSIANQLGSVEETKGYIMYFGKHFLLIPTQQLEKNFQGFFRSFS